MMNGVVAVCISASNGIEHCAIYTDIQHRDELLHLGQLLCKPYK